MGKKFKLDFDFKIEGTLIAVISAWPDYQMAWGISKHLDIELERAKDLNLSFNMNKKNSFLLYEFIDEYTTFRLLKNKAYEADFEKEPYLLPELKTFDYLFLIESEADLNIKDIDEKLKQIKSIQLTKILDPDTLKSKQNLAF